MEIRNFEVYENAQLTDLDAVQIGELYCSVGWGSGYTASQVKRFFSGSDYQIIVRSEGRIVGALRALSDGCLTTWIADVAVDPTYHQMGVGKSMMRKLIGHYGNTAIYTSSVKGSVGFFNKLGITEQKALIACSRRQD